MITAIVFALVGGLLAEAAELLRLNTGGIASVAWGIRLTLFLAYSVAALVSYGVAAILVHGRRGPLWLATALFGALVLIPWINFDYLPTFWSLRSLLSNIALALVVGAGAWMAIRFARLSVAAIVVMAIAANAMPHGGRERVDRPAERQAAAAPAINVVLLLLDTLRADHLGAYGYAPPTSPVFDQLAKGGVLFERASAQAAWTKPSVASLFTSAYVHRHGVIGSRDALGADLPLIAEQLRTRGLQTAAFSANPWITTEFGFDRGFEHFESANALGIQLTNLYRVLGRAQRGLAMVGVKTKLRKVLLAGPVESNANNSERDEILTDSAISWLGEHAQQPFFMYLHLMGPHDPYDPPDEFIQPFRDAAWAPGPSPTRPPARVQSIFETAAPLGRDELAKMVAQYDGAIRFTDAQVGRVVDTLTKLGVFDRTLLIIVGDHGEEFHEHGNWRHGNQMYNEVVHVPMLFHLPSVLRPGRRGDSAMLVDVFPSVLGFVAAPSAALTLDGRNLFTPGGEAPEAVFAEQWRFEGGEYVSRMVRHGDFKFIETHDESLGQRRAELYDLSSDPGEKRDLMQGDHVAQDADEMRELKSMLTSFGSAGPATSGRVADPSRATEERLRALGYDQ